MIRSLVGLSVRRRVSVLMVALAVAAFGGVALSRLPISLLPDISYPSITVETVFPDAAPGEVENLVTKPIEEAVGVLRGLREVHSVSRAGRSEVTLDFGWEADMDELALEVREKLDRVFLPDEAEDPLVLRYDPVLDPIMRLALSADADLTLVRRVAEKKVKESLETIPGIAAAKVKGGDEEEVQIDVDQGKLAALGISLESVAEVLRTSNINRPGGALKSTDGHFLVRTLNEYDSLAEIGDIAINPTGGAPIRLRDVAAVVWGTKEREEIVRVDGIECVEIAVYKEGDANSVAVARSIRRAVEWLPDELPDGMQLTILFDQARFIERSIDEVREALLLGGLLAILVVMGFLRDLRSTVIIATSIPLSVVACFVLMYRLDVSLNIMSLGGLTLGIGMLVDSSIVVLEAMDRRRRAGMNRAAAAVAGTTEVGGAVIASTLTTVAVFFPIVFVSGIAGQLFRDQALTVTFSLLASLVVAVSVIPMLASLGRDRVADVGGGSEASDEPLGSLSRIYGRMLRGVLRHGWLTLAVAAGIFAVALHQGRQLGTELIPSLSEGEFHFEVSLPEGTPLTATDRVIAGMEAIAAKESEVAAVYSSVGSRLVSGGVALRTTGENLGQLNIVMTDRTDDAAEERLAESLRRSFEGIPNLDVKIGRPSFFSLKTPVEMVFYGEDLAQLKDYVEELRPRVEAVAGVVDLRSSIEAGNPELSVVFDRDLLSRMGLSIREVADTLHNRVQGEVVSRFKVEDRQIDIRLRNRLADRNSVGAIENLVVGERNGIAVKLGAVATVASIRGPAEIHRIQQSRAAVLTAEVASGVSLGSVAESLKSAVAGLPTPIGITAEMAGQNREMESSFESLKFAFVLAIFLVYLVMAATFENLVHPFIILFTVPLALVGVVLGLRVSGQTISVISFLGAIFLAGVVVNNAIVLVDAINQGRREGLAKLEAVIRAGGLRLRPILMTTATTVLALLPMAIGFGEGSELRAPMAIVVVWGLISSTALTLLVVPAAYVVIPSRVRTVAEDEELEAALEAAGAGGPA